MNKRAQSQWQLYWSIIRSSSTAYKVVTAITLMLNLLGAFFILGSVVGQHEHYSVLILRAALDGLVFFALTHIFIRTYLKVKRLDDVLSWSRIWPFLLYLIPISIISVAGAYAIGEIEMLKFTQVENFQFTNDEGVIQVVISKVMFAVIGVVNAYLMFLFWVVIYLFWHQLLNRKKMQKELHQAQIQQLTNQLNPHFLFNAFNSIRALIYEDKDKAANTVTQLSELFRVHLQAHLKPKSTLGEEWQMSERYLAIEGIRLEERLVLNIDISDAVLGQYLPTLTLLTLVENAVKHGIAPNSEAGEIRIKALKINDTKWQLTVGNSINKTSTALSTNTGLKNVKQRISLMFADKCDLQQTSKHDYFEVTMELPFA